jgi:hypothetical protein
MEGEVNKLQKSWGGVESACVSESYGQKPYHNPTNGRQVRTFRLSDSHYTQQNDMSFSKKKIYQEECPLKMLVADRVRVRVRS